VLGVEDADERTPVVTSLGNPAFTANQAAVDAVFDIPPGCDRKDRVGYGLVIVGSSEGAEGVGLRLDGPEVEALRDTPDSPRPPRAVPEIAAVDLELVAVQLDGAAKAPKGFVVSDA